MKTTTKVRKEEAQKGADTCAQVMAYPGVRGNIARASADRLNAHSSNDTSVLILSCAVR